MQEGNRETHQRVDNPAPKNVVITGASGFIGRVLVVELVRRGYQVTALGRTPERLSALPCVAVKWNGRDATEPAVLAALRGADALIFLSGQPAFRSARPTPRDRWNSEIRKGIYESRVLVTRALVEAMATFGDERRCRLLICPSAMGLYGDCGDTQLEESSAPGPSSIFLTKMNKDWEQEAQQAVQLGIRVVIPRIGIVIGAGGGILEAEGDVGLALAKLPPVVPGSGRQWVSWVHLRDVVRFLALAVEDSNVSGAFNLTAPNPVRGAEFADRLAKAQAWNAKSYIELALRRKWIVPRIPAWVVRLAFGEMSYLFLRSLRVLPVRTQTTGFRFEFPTLEAALADLFPPTDR